MTRKSILLFVVVALTSWNVMMTSSQDMGDCVCMCDNEPDVQYITPSKGGKFLQSIKGQKGEMGIDGNMGLDGLAGPPGEIGMRGLRGGPSKQPSKSVATSCKQRRADGATANGIYKIKPPALLTDSIEVYCDMQTSGGGWTLVASIHENNIQGKCTIGDNWSSDLGTSSKINSTKNWESTSSFGNVEAATSNDYKSAAYTRLIGDDVMIWQVPNDVAASEWSSQAFLKYYTTSGFLSNYGGTLQILFSKYFPVVNKTSNYDYRAAGVNYLLASMNQSAEQMTGSVANWFQYNYDASDNKRISDGGNDMYDDGNKIYYRIGDGSFNWITYGQSYSELSSGTQVTSFKGHPFVMMMWISNQGGSISKFSIKVESGTGADSGGSHISYSNQLVVGNVTCNYESYNVFGTNDPSICEVYFACHNPNWGSHPYSSLTRDAWSSSSDRLVNTVTVTGSPQSILMGYTLLSSRRSEQSQEAVPQREVEAVLRIAMRNLNKTERPSDISCQRLSESLVVPVSYEQGSNEEVMARVPPMQRARVDPGFIHFRPISPTGDPFGICPGVKSSACLPESVCIGSINIPGKPRNCGDFAGWAGVPGSQPNETSPDGSAHSLSDIQSTFLIFTR